MSSITKDTVTKVGRQLNRLDITDAESEKMAGELEKIIGFIEQLAEVDTDGVEPLASVVNIPCRLRDDVVNDGNCADQVLANAPEEVQGFYAVPKVVE